MSTLREICGRATKGPWRVQGDYVGSDGATVCNYTVSSLATAEEQSANAQLIARMSPDTVLAAIDALELAHKRLFDMHSTHAANKCRAALADLNRET